jgi:hypothetical protein
MPQEAEAICRRVLRLFKSQGFAFAERWFPEKPSTPEPLYDQLNRQLRARQQLYPPENGGNSSEKEAQDGQSDWLHDEPFSEMDHAATPAGHCVSSRSRMISRGAHRRFRDASQMLMC